VVDHDHRSHGGRRLDLTPQMLAHLVGVDRRPARPQGQHAERPRLAGKRHRIDDVGMRARRVLEVEGHDRGPVDRPGVGRPPADVQEALLVEEAQVPRRVPAVVETPGRPAVRCSPTPFPADAPR
jgi:hypothetical protein